MKLAGTLAGLLLPLISAVSAADVDAWKSRNIYFALTDRVARGSDDTGGDACGDLSTYCGGTFKGLEGKLDYIKGMGFDAIWITPVVANHDGGYHGYWAKDLYSINENYGTADDLKSLVSAAHEKGIYIMADVVANHMGSPISDNKPEPLNQESAYHSACTIDYSNQESIETCRIADDLPDVNTESEEIRTLFKEWITWLVKEYEFDGLRIDTVKHVEKDFWSDFSSAAGVYTIGEVFDGDPDYLAGYASTMDGLLNYAVYYPVNNFYQQAGSAQDIVNMHDKIDNSFPDPSALGTFIDNHDNARWLSKKDDKSLLKNALAYVILARGIPIVYYGTEQGYAGGNDPENREDLWRSNYDTDADLYKAISLLSAARSAAGGLADNDHVHLHVAESAYAWSRAEGKLVVVTSNSGSGTENEICFDSKTPGGSWENIFGEGTISADDSGQICVSITNGEPAVLVAQS
ncbi:glycoside hydrolase superfamily [Aspergillus foveolatus]|uniref:glycoside hydrolase superfamily n=1 Tax=Aspergillus foveolatus TaxID=210207 RepID=UPI003CCD97C5